LADAPLVAAEPLWAISGKSSVAAQSDWEFARSTHPSATLPPNTLRSPSSRISVNFFRNFDRPFPEKEVRDALSNSNKISSGARRCSQQPQPKQAETHKYK